MILMFQVFTKQRSGFKSFKNFRVLFNILIKIYDVKLSDDLFS